MKNRLSYFRSTGFYFALFWGIFFSAALQAGNESPEIEAGERAPIDTLFHEPLTKGFGYISSNRYEDALALFDSLHKAFPEHPAPYLFAAITYQTWMLNFRFNEFQKQLDENVRLSIDKGNKMMEFDDNPRLNFYVASAYSFQALHSFRKHRWIGAYIAGRKAIGNYNRALKKMPNLYDCYLGLGSYHYWRTAKSKFIRIVAFWMRDRRELGLEQIKLSIDHGRYSPEEATYGLIIAYYDHGDYGQALALNAVAMKLDEPPSLGALYMRGRLMAHFERWPEVEEYYREILSRLIDQPYQSIGYQVECKYWICEALKAQNRLAEAYELAGQALVQSRSRKKNSELENPLENFEVIRKRLEKLHEKLGKELGR